MHIGCFVKLGPSSLLVPIALSFFWAGLSVGCNRERRETEQLLTEAAQSYDRLQPRLTELKAALGEMHKDVEDIAAKVPGGAEWRAKYFNADEVVGVLDAKMKWLSGRFESAKHDLKRVEVDGLRDAIAKTEDDMRQVNNVTVELTHEKARLQRVGALLKAPYEHQLSTGYQVKAANDGVESHLIDFIEDANKKADKMTWFDFDRLQFAGDSADLDFQGSISQLQNLAHILAAYPAVKLKIGGFTDNQGADTKLWANRAQAVRKALVQAGVSPERLEAQVYGSQHPVCRDNDSEVCRARNRRISALVTAK